MADTVDDFIRRFGGDQTVDDREAAHTRSLHLYPRDDSAFDNRTYHESATEYLGKLPDDEFHQAARGAIAQAPPQERQGLMSTLLGALGGGAASGGGLGALAGMLELGTTDPKRMSEDDMSRVMNYARREHPEAVQKVVQEKPWFVKAMGNPVVMGALTMAAAKMLQNQRRRSINQQQQPPTKHMQSLWMLIIGLIVGEVGKLSIMPGKNPGGIIVTMLIGIVGSARGRPHRSCFSGGITKARPPVSSPPSWARFCF